MRYLGIVANMWSLICLFLLVVNIGQVHGIEIRVSAPNLIRTDDSLPCGRIQCIDEVDASDGDSIKTLRINVNGIAANRNWTPHRAEAELILYNSWDCHNIEFVCEVILLDKLGAERRRRINSKFSIATHNGTAKDGHIIKSESTCQEACAANIEEILSPFVGLGDKVENLTKSDSKILDKLEQMKAGTSVDTTCLRERFANITETVCSLADLRTNVENLTKSDRAILSKLDEIQGTTSSLTDLESKIENHQTKSDSKILSRLKQIQETASSLNKLETKVAKLAESDSKILSKIEQIQGMRSFLNDIENKVAKLAETNSKLLSKLETLTDAKNEENNDTKNEENNDTKNKENNDTKNKENNDTKNKENKDTKNEENNDTNKSCPHLTTCPRTPSQPQGCRFQIVRPLDGTPDYLCDTDSGGWTVIQRRINGKTDFYRNWFSYKHGFGSFDGDFWLGLERIHQITSSSNQELMITMMYNGTVAHAHYDNFRVAGEKDKYRLYLGAYSGTAGNSLLTHNKMQFSTFDKDNDKMWTMSCARRYHGAWWYSGCCMSNLNGECGYRGSRGPMWSEFTGYESATMTEMKIREML